MRVRIGVAMIVLGACLVAHAQSVDKAREKSGMQKATLAQILVTRNVEKNLKSIRRAFAQAEADGAGWIFFPEGALSGYSDKFDQERVARGFEEVQQLCKKIRINALLGTCWKEGGKTFNEIRLVDCEGKLVGRYAKQCLTYGDAKQFVPGTFPFVHEIGGITWGTLICNDFWVTPGFSDGPDPHLSLQAARGGAQVIFQCVNSGTDQKYRSFHESNLMLRSAEAKCPIIVVNAAGKKAINCTSGVVDGFKYLVELPREGEVIRTVKFTPSKANSSKK
jgi:predicted amidohydrolase